MAELVFGARSRAARLRGLHGETAQQQPFGQLFDLLHIARMHACGIGQSLFQPVLHQSEGEIVHRLRPHGVGKHPVGPGRDLGDQVGVARSRHSGGRSRRNQRIENHAQRRRTVEGLLVAVLGDRGSVGRVTVHRSRRADHHVTAAVVVGAEFGQVVDHARTDGHGNGIGRSQHTVQLLDERPFGVEFRIGEHVRFVLPDPRIGEDAVHLAAGDAPRIGVGDHDGAAAGKQLVEHLRRPRKGSDADHQRFGVGRALKGALYLIHRISA